MVRSYLFLFSLSLSMLTPHIVHADSKLKIKEFRVLRPSDLPPTNGWVKELNKNQMKKSVNASSVISLTPDGSLNLPMSYDCQPSTIKTALASQPNVSRQAKTIDSYFKKCGQRLSLGKSTGLIATGALSRLSYEIFENKNVKPYRLILSNGDSLEGFTGIHTDDIARPIVVIRCGLFCDGAGAGTTKMMLMHLFEESPFHVMIVQSLSSNKNIIPNNRIVIGGLYEAQENMVIGNWLKTASPFRDKISSLHMLGVSLGGSSAYYTSLYNSLNLDQNSDTLFNSVLAFCPVADAKTSIFDLYNNSGKFSETMALTTKKNFKAAHFYVDDLMDLVNIDDPLPAKDITDLLGELSTRYLKRVDSRHFPVPFRDMPLASTNDFWARSNFLNFYHLVTTPTIAWGSLDDPVVSMKNNSLKLKSKLKSNSPIQVSSSKYGGHCAFSVSYGWPVTSAILSGFFLSNSPEFTPLQKTRYIDVDFSSANIEAKETHVGQSWKATAGESKLVLTFKTWQRGRFVCSSRDPFTQNKYCYDSKEITLDIAALTLPFDIPKTENDADRLTRWLNSNLSVQSSRGSILGTTDQPIRISYKAPDPITQ